MIIVNKEECIGCELCVQIAPESFEMDKDNKAILIADMNKKNILEAIESCPVEAIQ